MGFDLLSDLVNGVTQNYFGESATYIRGTEETAIKAVFDESWIESGGVATKALTCEVLSSDIPLGEPKKGDQVRRGSTTYKVNPPQGDAAGKIHILILKE